MNGMVHRDWLRFRIKGHRVRVGFWESWSVRFGVGRRVRIGHNIRRSSGKAAKP
jgi:hypothetical protein